MNRATAQAFQRSDVPAALSDLFFNHENENARILDDKGEFLGFDEEQLKRNATDVLIWLKDLGVVGLPEPEALAADFLSRC